MRAIVATAKFRSARRHRCDHFIWRLAFIVPVSPSISWLRP